MTSSEREKTSTYDFLMHLQQDELDCVALVADRHYLACWTLLVKGKREVVALEVRPKRAGRPSQSVAVTLLREWLMPATTLLARDMPKSPAPVTAALLRTIPLRQVMSGREEALRKAELTEGNGPVSLVTSTGAVHALPKLSGSESSHLLDAFLYVSALESGSRSPAQAIGAHRGIEPRTAQGRIAKARTLGFLTPVERGQLGSQLTPKAKRLRAALESWASIAEGEKNG